MTAIPSTASRDVTPEAPPTTPLRIAMVAPPFYPIPPSAYGGIEAVVAQLADGLVDRGHEVTLIAARGSRTKAHLLTTFDEPQWERLGRAEPELLHAARVSEHLADIGPDLVHDHSAAGPAFVRDRSVPTVVTSHGPATGDWGEYLEAGGDGMYLVAISQAQVDLSPPTAMASRGAQQSADPRHPVPGGKGGLPRLAGPNVPGQGGPPGHRCRTQGGAAHRLGRKVQRARRAGLLRGRGASLGSARTSTTTVRSSWTTSTSFSGEPLLSCSHCSGRSRSAWC